MHQLGVRLLYKADYFAGDLQCNVQPYLVEGNIWNATKAGVCPERSAFVTRIRAMGVSIGYGPKFQPAFDGRCSFTSEACATQVCTLQRTRVNATGKNEFMCMSDPAIAAAAVAGTYWFAPGGSTNQPNVTSADCAEHKPKCWGLKYVDANGTTVTSAAGQHRTLPSLALLAVVSSLVGVVAACGIVA